VSTDGAADKITETTKRGSENQMFTRYQNMDLGVKQYKIYGLERVYS